MNAPKIIIPAGPQDYVPLDKHLNMEHTGERMAVFRDKDGHLYPRDEEFEIQVGLEPGYTTDGKNFEVAGEVTRKVGDAILTIPTVETDINGVPLDVATVGIEGGFEDADSRTSKAKRKLVRDRNAKVGSEGEAESIL